MTINIQGNTGMMMAMVNPNAGAMAAPVVPAVPQFPTVVLDQLQFPPPATQGLAAAQNFPWVSAFR